MYIKCNMSKRTSLHFKLASFPVALFQLLTLPSTYPFVTVWKPWSYFPFFISFPTLHTISFKILLTLPHLINSFQIPLSLLQPCFPCGMIFSSIETYSCKAGVKEWSRSVYQICSIPALMNFKNKTIINSLKLTNKYTSQKWMHCLVT